MIYLLISLQILWMGVNGHAIEKLQINNVTSDVYEIKEDKSTNTISFVNPKSDHQTLREIVYYHLIERPYGQSEVVEETEGPDFDETLRPFTNSHGFPFLESFEKDTNAESDGDEQISIDVPQESEATLGSDNHDSSGPEEEVVYEYYDEAEAGETDKSPVVTVDVRTSDTKDEVGDTDKTPVVTVDIRPSEIAEKPVDTPVETTTEPQLVTTAHQESTTLVEDVAVQNLEVTTAAKEAVLEKKAKIARKSLFERIKERYSLKNNQTQSNDTTSSSERRKREIKMHIPDAPRLGPLNYDSLPPYLRGMFSTEDPQPRGRHYHPDSDEDERLMEIRRKMENMMDKLKDKTERDESEEPPAPRTYGMNLTEDHGYVWNDMWSHPGVHYSVEGSESIEEVQKPDVDGKEIPVDNTDDKHGDKGPTEHPDNFDKSEENHIDEHKSQNNDKDRRKEGEVINKDDKLKNKVVEDENAFEDLGKNRQKDKKKETTMSELLDNDEFWKWLTDWTSVYMDALTDHIKEAVQEEVSTQIKPYVEEHKDENKIPSKDDKKTPDKKDDETKQSESGKEQEKFTKEDEKKDDGQNEEDMLKRRKDKEDKKKPNNNSIVDHEKERIKNSTIEENSNAKENKTELEQKNKHDPPSQIEAQNIYGNSIGSDKVTNIFIFYPNTDANKIISEVKNNSESEINVFGNPNITVDERINVPDKEKEDKSTQTEKEKENDNKDEIIPSEEREKEIKDSTTQAPVDKEDKDAKEVTEDVTTETPTSTKRPEENIIAEATETSSTENNNAEITTESNKEEPKKDSENDEKEPTEETGDKLEEDKKENTQEEDKRNETSTHENEPKESENDKEPEQSNAEDST